MTGNEGTPRAAEGGWSPPVSPASAERVDERNRLVAGLAAPAGNGRMPVGDPAVLRAMKTVPRHVFVPLELRDLAYEDCPLPIGHGQTISQPYIVARMTEFLQVTPASRILEIGTGSGYQCAVLAQLTPRVYTVETHEGLAARAARVLRQQRCTDIHFRVGDGHLGWPEAAPFDGIVVTCCATHVPSALWEQVAPGGRIVIPVGESPDDQWLGVIEKTHRGQRRSQAVMPVRFVPMVG